MPDNLPAIRPPFEINKTRGEGIPIARLPMLGIDKANHFGSGAVSDVESYLTTLHASIGDLRSAAEGTIVEAAKALGVAPPQAQAYARMAFMPDPANYGLMAWPGIQPDSLRKVASENLLPQMIIRNRVGDLRRYAQLSTHLWKPGWRITMRDPKETPTRSDLNDMRDAERFICNCSRDVFRDDPRARDASRITAFDVFLAGAAGDTLTFDGWAIWTQTDVAGRVREFCNLPAGLIRLAVPGRGYKGNPDNFAALIDEVGNPVQAFTRKELTWAIRNVRNDPSVAGYGWSEIEMAIRAIQGYQGAVDLNVDTFKKTQFRTACLSYPEISGNKNRSTR